MTKETGYGIGLTEDQLREAMMSEALACRRAIIRRDGHQQPMADHLNNQGNSERARARGEATRQAILDQLAGGEKKAQDIEVGVQIPQVKGILRGMLEKGIVSRRYKRHEGGRIALWALTPDGKKDYLEKIQES